MDDVDQKGRGEGVNKVRKEEGIKKGKTARRENNTGRKGLKEK